MKGGKRKEREGRQKEKGVVRRKGDKKRETKREGKGREGKGGEKKETVVGWE
jgi:hypothetical protein